MPVLIDHVFICTGAGAPAAKHLIEFGLCEGSPNRHDGQGTACRRFFFENAMLELMWVDNAADAQSEQTRRTRLWPRWSNAGSTASPFGVIVRPEPGLHNQWPFQSWTYQPERMPGLLLSVASGTLLEEPMWGYMERGRAPVDVPPEMRQPLVHPVGFHKMTMVRISGPPLAETTVTQALASEAVIGYDHAPHHLLQLEFDEGLQGEQVDFRPALPLIIRW